MGLHTAYVEAEMRMGKLIREAEYRFFISKSKMIYINIFQISIIWYICSWKRNNMAKVIHVHLLHSIEGTKRKDWYFSSISAVYTVLTADQVGATKNYLLHAGLSGNGTVCTKKAIIKQSTLISGGSGAITKEWLQQRCKTIKIPFYWHAFMGGVEPPFFVSGMAVLALGLH